MLGSLINPIAGEASKVSEFYSSHQGHEPLPGDGIDIDSLFSLTQVTNDGHTLPLDARFRYSQRDPYAVRILFLCGEQPVEWTFGRELFIDGVYAPTGNGDVKAWPTLSENGEAHIAFSLRNVRENFVGIYTAPTRDMMLFLDQTLDLVPQGFESQPYERAELTIQQFLGK